MNDRAWNHAVFSKNRERLLAGDVAAAFFSAVTAQTRARKLLSDEHSTVDGTLIEAWASHKSFRPKDSSDDDAAGGEGGFRGRKRRNDTHRSTTDPDVRLYRKGGGREARLVYLGHMVIDNRHGLAVDALLTEANGRAEREAALEMAARLPGGPRRVTLGADKGYDAADLVAGLRDWGVTPQVAQNLSGRRSRIDGRTTRHAGYRQSQKQRKLVEQVFG